MAKYFIQGVALITAMMLAASDGSVSIGNNNGRRKRCKLQV